MKINPLEGIERDDYIRALEDVIDRWNHDLRCPYKSIYPDDERDFKYAYDRIRPSSHLEHLLVSKWGLSSRKRIMVDEYVSRREGEKPQLPDHPFISYTLEKWGLPNPCNLLAFKEHLMQVFDEINRPDKNYMYDELKGFHFNIEGKFSKKYFRTMVKAGKVYHKLLNEKDIDDIYEVLLFYARMSWYPPFDYVVCSSMTDKAFFLAHQRLCNRQTSENEITLEQPDFKYDYHQAYGKYIERTKV